MASMPSYHLLDFFHDNEDGCALTITQNSVRFHIIADAKRLKRESDKGEGRNTFDCRKICEIPVEAKMSRPQSIVVSMCKALTLSPSPSKVEQVLKMLRRKCTNGR